MPRGLMETKYTNPIESFEIQIAYNNKRHFIPKPRYIIGGDCSAATFYGEIFAKPVESRVWVINDIQISVAIIHLWQNATRIAMQIIL